MSKDNSNFLTLLLKQDSLRAYDSVREAARDVKWQELIHKLWAHVYDRSLNLLAYDITLALSLS